MDAATRELVRERAENRCEYCLFPMFPILLSLTRLIRVVRVLRVITVVAGSIPALKATIGRRELLYVGSVCVFFGN